MRLTLTRREVLTARGTDGLRERNSFRTAYPLSVALLGKLLGEGVALSPGEIARGGEGEGLAALDEGTGTAMLTAMLNCSCDGPRE